MTKSAEFVMYYLAGAAMQKLIKSAKKSVDSGQTNRQCNGHYFINKKLCYKYEVEDQLMDDEKYKELSNYISPFCDLEVCTFPHQSRQEAERFR